MVRVLMISVLAFGALVLVTQALPVQAPPEPLPVTSDSGTTLADWEGTWHGTFNIYNMNGTLVSTVSRRIERFPADIGQDVTVTNIDGEKSTVVSHAHQSFDADSARSREADHDGRVRVLTGRVIGSAILWHHEDPATGIRMVSREEVLPSGLYTVDGVEVIGDEVRFYEGRYTRSP